MPQAGDALRDPDAALYARMRWNAPLSVQHADLLLDRMSLRPGEEDDCCSATASGPAALPEATALFGEDTMPLPGLMEACRAAGWRVIHLSTASQLEWDDFESAFRAGRQEWLLANPGHPRASEIRDWIDARERQYVTVYREVLGFAHLVLAR